MKFNHNFLHSSAKLCAITLLSITLLSTITQKAHASSSVSVSDFDQLWTIIDELESNGIEDDYTIIFESDIAQSTSDERRLVTSPGDKLTWDLAGHSLTVNTNDNHVIDNGATLNITGNGLITDYEGSNGVEVISNAGTLNLISGTITRKSTSSKFDNHAAIYHYGEELSVSDGFTIRAEGAGAVGVMIVTDGIATFGNVVGTEAEPVSVYGETDGVVVIRGTAIFNNGQYHGGSRGIYVTNSARCNTPEALSNTLINYAEITSDGEYDFYAGVDDIYSEEGDGQNGFCPDNDNINLVISNSALGAQSYKGYATSENSQKDWSINISRSNFDVTVTDKVYEFQNRTPDTPSVSEDGTVSGKYPYYAFLDDPEHPWTSIWDALDATGDYKYNDDFFATASPGEHAKLRVVSYALALAGFENQSDGYPYDDTEEANPKLRKLLSEIGFSDYEYWDEASDEDGHTMGTSIAHKVISYKDESGSDQSKELIVVAPRNYNYMAEWLSNFNIGTSGDHVGFTEAATLIVSRLNQYISSHNLSDYKIWIVGYSRGGAVVDLAAKMINENINNYSMSPDDLYAYTFGAPRASVAANGFTNVHDVKDGNDLLLGYFFPQLWGFYNTGTYEEIHAPDLTITTSALDTTKLTDGSEVLNVLLSGEDVVINVGSQNAKEFIDEWFAFITENGLDRDYFDAQVKPPLSGLMKVYQGRTLDKQSEVIDFITSTDSGMLGIVVQNIFKDLAEGGYSSLDDFPPYQDIVKILRGTANDQDINELTTTLERYIGEYQDYLNVYTTVALSESEFIAIKENLPALIKALAPVIVADARYTTTTYGDNTSLYYTTTLVSNARNLAYAHFPESIMPLLESLVPEEDDPGESGGGDEPLPPVPNTGAANTSSEQSTKITGASLVVATSILIVSTTALILKNTTKKPVRTTKLTKDLPK